MYEMAHWRRETLERTPLRSTPHITENLRDRISAPAHEDESHDRTEEHAQKEGGIGRLAAPKKQQEDGVGGEALADRLHHRSFHCDGLVVLIHYKFMKKEGMRLQLARRVTRHDHGLFVALICRLHTGPFGRSQGHAGRRGPTMRAGRTGGGEKAA